jgi:hypothetical protein
LNAKFGQILLFELFANRTFEFKIEHGKNGKKFSQIFENFFAEIGEYLVPNLRLCTPELAEEGEIRIGNGIEQGEETCLRVEVKNVGKLLAMKLRIALHLFDE